MSSTDILNEQQSTTADGASSALGPMDQQHGFGDLLGEPLIDPLLEGGNGEPVQFFLGSLPTDDGPFQKGPVYSLARYKEDIRYLSDADKDDALDLVLATRLARYRYKGTDPSAPERMGFLIDDQPADSPAVLPDGQRVDVYGFVSMAVAALQAQQTRIEVLSAQVLDLQQKLVAR